MSQQDTTDTPVTTEAAGEVTVTNEEVVPSTEEVTQNSHAPIHPAPPQVTPLSQELASLKVEKALLQELAESFTIRRHLPPEAYEDSNSCELSESTDVIQDEQQASGVEAEIQQNFTQETETLSEEHQEIRDKEMETVD